MFRTLIYPLSGPCDYSVELPHWSYCSWFDVCWSFGVVGLEWYPCYRLKHFSHHSNPTQPHRNSNIHRTKNNTTNVVIQQNSRKLLMMDILMSETCWAHKKWNKIASDIKLVFYSSTITMAQGPINTRLCRVCLFINFKTLLTRYNLRLFRSFRKIENCDYYIRHVRLSVYVHGITRLPLGGFSLNFIFECSSKICQEMPSLIKIWQE